MSRLLFIIILSLFPFYAFSQITQLNIKREYPTLSINDDLWIGTPGGLYQYVNKDDSYKLFLIPGKEGSQVKYMYYNNEWLWCVLDTGLAALQVRLNQWMVFDKTKGLPSNNVTGLDFQGDYVWIATDNGAARFDLLIEEWETYGLDKGVPDLNLQKVLVVDNMVWFITPHGLSEYNSQFEKWRHFTVPPDQQLSIYDAFVLNNDIWLICNKGLIKFNTQLNSQEYFFDKNISSSSMINLAYENNTIWLLSENGIFYIQTESQVLKEFEGNYFLKDYSPVNFNLDSREIWVSTDKGILEWNRSDKTWKNLDYASGLSDSLYANIYLNGDMVFLLNENIIDYRLTPNGAWKKFNLRFKSGFSKQNLGKNLFKNLLDNEEGGFIGLGKNKLKFDGTRINYIYDKNFDGKTNSGKRLDVKSQLTLGDTRNLYGFYNNVEFSENMYGLRYKSTAAKDLVREINLGDFRKEPGDIPFGENTSVFGANVWLQAGEKTERFKRSKYSIKAMTGQLRSKKVYENYQGATNKFNFSVNDVSYVRNTFFSIPNLPLGTVPEQIEIFLDDMISADNTKNTLVRNSIAGIQGDFDQLCPTEDYNFNSRLNVLRILKPVRSNYVLVIRYRINGITYEEILKAPGITTAKENIYFLDGSSIIPNSFYIEIRDSLNRSFSLSDFGIDSNGDGKADPEWLDYENGFLMFPENHPFPAQTYDSAAHPNYKLMLNFETKRWQIKLNHKDLVRGSEIVLLDGNTAIPGSDYTLDYTGGTIVFVREGLVNLDTRIEIEYEYYLDSETNEQVHAASINFSPSDNFYIQADWLNFKKNENYHNDSVSNLLSLHNEIRNKIGEHLDFRLISGAAYQAEDKKISGEYVEGLISTEKFRFQSKYANYDTSYANLYEHRNVTGKIKNSLQFFSSADLTSFVKLTGDWKNEESFKQKNLKNPENRIENYSILFHKTNLPSLQISYQDLNTETDTSKLNKYFVSNQLEYQLPEGIMRHLLVKSIKLEANYRQGKQSGMEILGTEKQRFDQKYIKVNSNFTDKIIGSFYYRCNDYFDDSDSADRNFLCRSEHVLINFAQEQWRTVQLNLSVENTFDQNHVMFKNLKSSKINKYSQANIRFSPGQIWSRLNPLFFEFNVDQSATDWGSSDKQNENEIWRFYRSQSLFDYSQLVTNCYVRNEFRPNSNILLYSLLEWNNQRNESGASFLKSWYRQWNEKLELKAGFNLRFVIQYKQFYQDNGFNRINQYFEPSACLEHRWNSNLQDMTNVQYRSGSTRQNNMSTNTTNWLITYNFIWRKERFLKLNKIEIRNDISSSISRSSGDSKAKVNLYTTNSALDIYPFASAIFRFQIQYKNNEDWIMEKNSTTQFAYNFKFILKF